MEHTSLLSIIPDNIKPDMIKEAFDLLELRKGQRFLATLPDNLREPFINEVKDLLEKEQEEKDNRASAHSIANQHNTGKADIDKEIKDWAAAKNSVFPQKKS
jgi:hypothetical protein